MNFAAKLNVVAAYAAFAFVCAIVFGMVWALNTLSS